MQKKGLGFLITTFLKKSNFDKFAKLYIKFPIGTPKNITMLRFFHFHIFLIYIQIWLDHFMDDHPCGNITKLEREKLL